MLGECTVGLKRKLCYARPIHLALAAPPIHIQGSNPRPAARRLGQAPRPRGAGELLSDSPWGRPQLCTRLRTSACLPPHLGSPSPKHTAAEPIDGPVHGPSHRSEPHVPTRARLHRAEPASPVDLRAPAAYQRRGAGPQRCVAPSALPAPHLMSHCAGLDCQVSVPFALRSPRIMVPELPFVRKPQPPLETFE